MSEDLSVTGRKAAYGTKCKIFETQGKPSWLSLYIHPPTTTGIANNNGQKEDKEEGRVVDALIFLLQRREEVSRSLCEAFHPPLDLAFRSTVIVGIRPHQPSNM